MALDPNIILQAGRGVQPIDVGQIMQLRDLSAQRQAQTAEVQRQGRVAADKQVRLGQIGSIAATGDLNGARTAALQTGDFDLVDHVNKLDDRAKSSLAAKVGVAAPVFATALTERDPVKRTQIIAAAVPTLKANGYTDEEIAKINPTDEFLRGAVANAQSIGDIIKQQQFGIDQAGKDEDRTLRREDQRLDRENARGNAYISAGLLPPDAPGGGTALSGTGGDVVRLINTDAGGGQVPESVRTLGQFVEFGRGLNQKGARSSSAGTYQINGSTMREFGPRALGAGWKDAPFDASSQEAVGRAIFDWAKQQRNPVAALKGRWVSLSTAEARSLVGGSWENARETIARNETGGGAGASAAAPAGGLRVIPGGKLDQSADELTPDAMERAAIVYGTTGQMPQGLGRAGVTQKAILNKWAEIASKGGTTPQQQVENWQTQKAQTAAVKNFATGKQAATVRSLNVAIDHLHTLQIAAQALQNGDVPAFNRVRQFVARQTGASAPTNFEAIKGIVADEVTKAVIGGGNAGALADREETKATIKAASSPEQLAGVIAKYTELMGGQLNGLRQEYETGTGRKDFNSRLLPMTRRRLGIDTPRRGGTLSPRGGAVTRVTNADDYNRLPSGARYLDPQGNQRTKR